MSVIPVSLDTQPDDSAPSPCTTWSYFDTALQKFICFLRKAATYGTLRDYHIMFNMGTIVRLSLSLPLGIELSRAIAIQSLLDDGYPYVAAETSDRVAIPGEDISIHHQPTPSSEECIINISLNDAERPVPAPKDEEHRESMSDGDILWVVLWPYKSHNIINLAISGANQPMSATLIAGECRRLDFAEHTARVLIAPDLTITSLQ